MTTLSQNAFSSTSSSNSNQISGSDEDEEDSRDGDEDDVEEKYIGGSTTTADDFLSSSPSVASVCALTDILPRDLYLHVCSFLSEADCCTLLEVSLRMHAAITCADSYVWRRLCMNTWKCKQGFQTFLQRVRALEGLARREELEVQALQQHMLLVREQDTFLGESDVSATCDDATVLIRRRQHERAQWMAAAAAATSLGSPSFGGNNATSAAAGLNRARRSTAVSSSTSSSTSSETLSNSDEDDEEREHQWDEGTPRRRRGRKSNRRRTSTKDTHRSSTAAATASTSRRSGKQSSCAKGATSSAYSGVNGTTERSRTSASRSHSAPSQSHQQHRSLSLSKFSETPSSSVAAHSEKLSRTPPDANRSRSLTQRAAQGDSCAVSNAASAQLPAEKQLPLPANSSTFAAAMPVHEEADDGPEPPFPRVRGPCRIVGEEKTTVGLRNERGDATLNGSITSDEREEGRGKDRRVRIQLPEDATGKDMAPPRNSRSELQDNAELGSPGSGPSTPARTTKHSRQRYPSHTHRHHLHHHSHQSDTPKGQGGSQPPISRHRRSHSVKKRKPAKQRRRRRGRSCRPRATGGGGGRHRSQHHRSQSRHHRASRPHQHNTKATRSTRRRRRRQRNAAATAAAAAEAAANNDGGARARNGTGNYSSSSLNVRLGAASGGAAVGTGHGGTYFYQTPTYEAIKNTTPVLSVQHVAPAPVPFQLGGRLAPLQKGGTPASSASPVVSSTIPRYPSRDIHGNTGQDASTSSGQPSPNRNAGDNAAAFRMLPTACDSTSNNDSGRGNCGGTESAVAAAPPLLSPSTLSWNAVHGRNTTTATAAPPPSLPSPSSAAAGGGNSTPATAVPPANPDEGDGLYWWQLTPEARQQQLRRMQQHEQRQQQQHCSTVTATATGEPSQAAPDGEEVADEAALREWDALEASFGWSAGAGGAEDEEDTEDDDDDDSSQSDAEDDSQGSSSNTPSEASAITVTDSSSNPTEVLDLRAWHSRAASSRLPSHHRRRSLNSSRRRSYERQRHRSRDNSLTASSGGTGTSPPSSATSQSSRLTPQTSDVSNDVVSARHQDDSRAQSRQESTNHGNIDGESVVRSCPHRNGVKSGGSHHRGRPASLSSFSRLSMQAGHQLSKTLAKRYEGIEEAMIITRSKSVLIHTLECQTYAHLPRLLAAAAAQRQRRVTLAARVAVTADAASSGVDEGSTRVSGASARPVLLLGSERSPVPSPPAAAATKSTLPSSLSNSYTTNAGVAFAVPASPLHQLARISSATALADGVVLHSQNSPYPTFTVQPTLVSGGFVSASHDGQQQQQQAQHFSVSGGDPSVSHPQLVINAVSADDRSLPRLSTGEHGSSAHENDDELDEEEEPLAPVSWKFAYFMSRREARRATITLQDLLEGMWLVCFRSTGRTHPIRFTRRMQVVVYPPLKTAEEEAEEEVEGGEGGGAAAATAATTTATVAAVSAIHQSRLSLAVARAVPFEPNGRTGALPSTATAPPLPFHVLQGGAQLVVHQFPPMKVQRRSTFAVPGGPISTAATYTTTSTTTTTNASAAATDGTSAQRAAAAEAERRFLAEPQASLRRLRLRMLTMDDEDENDGSAAPGTAQVDGEADSAKRSSVDDNENFRAWRDTHDAADVTQASVRRFIAQQLGFAGAYVVDVLGPSSERGTAAVYGVGKGPHSGGLEAGNSFSPERKDATLRKNWKGRKRHLFIGPPTLKEFEAQQRQEACFTPGGVADVLDDWGWTITGHHVKIFSLDVTAPLYVERLQRVVDVEVMGRSHCESRAARRV
ncbi:hypothetical protein ABB37_00261 [Leptomonas pyrrhocoris]|uniref:F-box domain-containing protein n=1 Tax=Leptomonas pyrrhocoris TaxID=157538 RepID=A0A0M9GAE4_LEPPY|nr:hypothetical protein ABB37_00261 [Leptomonas pyrrhocoris]KPA85966.1 hypothetical protein ABB37_00261 [Leptomonas pyrrhocoris]|eukprot:XP_015664405.1 hypothetical protein ABB37_00261 [Leptomonas pyrrhocoris]